ncbi:unnamed protein product, partial [Polarella glacialis]
LSFAAAALVGCLAWEKVPKVFVHSVPDCANADHLLGSLPGDDGVPVPLTEQANALYMRKIASQVRPLHQQLLSGGSSGAFSLTADPDEADLFYIPALFSVLFWIGSSEAIDCVAQSFAQLRDQPHFLRRGGKDHLILYGVEFSHYRAGEPEFSLDHYDASAANWIVLTVACPLPCGAELDSWNLRGRFVVLPHASRMDWRRGGPQWAKGLNETSAEAAPARRFLVGFVGALGPGKRHPERRAFFELTCSSTRWLRTEDGAWRSSSPWTKSHYVLGGNSTVMDAFLLSKEAFSKLCSGAPAAADHQRRSDLPDLNFWWIEPEWRWRLIPEVEPPDGGAYFQKAFSIPFYGFSDGSLAAEVDGIQESAGRVEEVLSAGGLPAERRLQPQFNSLLFDTIYGHSEMCLILPGDTADCAKRLWDVNSTSGARRVLLALSKVPKAELQRRRAIMRQWLPLLVVERLGARHASSTSALDLAVQEAAERSAASISGLLTTS